MRNRKILFGFTLVELLVVVAIIALLMTLLMPTITAATNTVRGAMTRAIIKQLGLALENFHTDFGAYPPSKPRDPPTGTKNPLTASGDMDTGAANLAYYLRGPSATGWGFGAGGTMPFGGMPQRTYGPHYQVGDEGLRFNADGSLAGIIDAFQPPGLILYFRAEAVEGSGRYVVEHNNKTGASTTDGKYNYASVGGQTQQQSFINCASINLTETNMARIKYFRQDYLLVSPGADKLYGYVVEDKNTGKLSPARNGEGAPPDIMNWR